MCDQRCVGSCCAVFSFLDPADPRFAGIKDEDHLRDMLVPLDLQSAADRLAELNIEPYWADESAFDWDGRCLEAPGRRLMMCRHWDTSTRLCTAYESRPHMCRDYPYTALDCDYHCGFHLDHEQVWDYALRVGGPEHGTPPNIIRSEN